MSPGSIKELLLHPPPTLELLAVPDAVPQRQRLSAARYEIYYLYCAAHEAGHRTVAESFGVPCEAHLAFVGPDILYPLTLGPLNKLPPFRRAVVGWGGLAGEYLLGHIWRPVGAPSLIANTVEDWAAALLKFPDSVMGDDLKWVEQSDPIIAARFAYKILSSPTGCSRLWDSFEEIWGFFRIRHAKHMAKEKSPLCQRLQALTDRIAAGMTPDEFCRDWSAATGSCRTPLPPQGRQPCPAEYPAPNGAD